MEKKYVICINRAGLGNRIKGLVSAMRLSAKLGRKHLVYWQNNQYCGCYFADLFENQIPIIGDSQLKEIQKKNSKKYNDVLDEAYDSYNYILLYTWKFIFLPGEIPTGFSQVYSSEEGTNIDFEYGRIPEDKKQEILVQLNKLVPVKEIRDKIEEFTQKNNVNEMVGVHIRRGDTKFTVEGKQKVSSDERFIERMKEFPEEQKFFLCTDGEETEQRFKEIFGERIVVFPKGTRKRFQKEALQEALIDMLLLSKTKHILGSYLSTFTELAWWFGGCKAKIEVVGSDTVKESLKPKSKIISKIKFYKVIFLRWLFGSYR